METRVSNLSKKKKRCRDCAALVASKGKWICDEYGKDVEEIEKCPEGLKIIQENKLKEGE